MSRLTPLRITYVDMNNGLPNQAARCFKLLIDVVANAARAANPGLEVSFEHVQPRNLGEQPSPETDLIVSSGGPGAPTDGFDDPWCTGYRAALDRVVERTIARPDDAPAAFVVCHSFEISVLHFKLARMAERESLKFGVFPSYLTNEGHENSIFAPFADSRLFTWEHRRWEAIDLDEKRLEQLGGKVLARESREGASDKGKALTALEFAPGVIGTQFHPEADRPGVLLWVRKDEHSEALREAYGEEMLQRMLKTLSDPDRLARTFALVLPGWLTERFNHLAKVRGYQPIPAPHTVDMSIFESVPAAG